MQYCGTGILANYCNKVSTLRRPFGAKPGNEVVEFYGIPFNVSKKEGLAESLKVIRSNTTTMLTFYNWHICASRK